VAAQLHHVYGVPHYSKTRHVQWGQKVFSQPLIYGASSPA